MHSRTKPFAGACRQALSSSNKYLHSFKCGRSQTKPVQTCKRLLQVLTGKQECLNHYFPALSKPADTDLSTCAVGLDDSGYRRVNVQIFSKRS